ncbi:MAG: GDT1-like protein [Amphiamblys sp. WSBS2006]|nr:MAG: GDT1-like protein [Amphiamblys sp. WSBS2006]
MNRNGFVLSFFKSLFMILLSETGDKTFISAAIMSMKYSRAVIFASTISALASMTVISVLFGNVFLSYIPKRVTELAVGIIFGVFGVKMFYDAARDGFEEEYERLEEETESQLSEGRVEGQEGVFTRIKNSIFFINFLITFLAEWGDRSQITSFILGVEGNVFGVVLGCIAGHTVCTAAAVTIGKYISERISLRMVFVCGGCVFVVFSLLSFHSALLSSVKYI